MDDSTEHQQLSGSSSRAWRCDARRKAPITVSLTHLNEDSGTNAHDATDEEFDGSVVGGAGRGTRQEWKREYSGYDKVGNRLQLVKNDGLEDITVNYSYNDLNQLTVEGWVRSAIELQNLYDYDLNGNLTSKEETA